MQTNNRTHSQYQVIVIENSTNQVQVNLKTSKYGIETTSIKLGLLKKILREKPKTSTISSIEKMATAQEVINALAAQIADLQAKFLTLQPPTPTVYAPVTPTGVPTSTRLCTNLPTYDGDTAELFAWIRRCKEIMNLYHNTPLECEALTIIRTKIIGRANKTLDNDNVPLNFDAIIVKLIAVYSDKRPIDLLQGLLIRTKQNDLSIQAYYEVLCEKMNEIFYKVELENQGRDDFIAGMKSMIELQAKDTFLTWINPKIRHLLQARNPSNLQEAKDIAIVLETKNIWRQELEFGSDKQQQNKKPNVVHEYKKPLIHEKKPFSQNHHQSSFERPKFQSYPNPRQFAQSKANPRQFSQPFAAPQPMMQHTEPMDIDKSTVQRKQNVGGESGQRRFFKANVLEGKIDDPEGLLEEIPEQIIRDSDFLV